MGLAVLRPGRAAAAPLCQVVDTTSNVATSYTTLQAAVSAANAGDTLKVMGTCSGDTTINVNLTIVGDSDQSYGVATLVGGPGAVVTISSTATVTIKGLVITSVVGAFGGGIHNAGTLTLTHSTVSGNSASSGGGIYSSGTLSLDDSTVSGNHGSFGGGGI